MRVHIFDLKPDLQVTINGTESWLDKIYADFPHAGDGDRPRITADLRLSHEDGGTVYVAGKVNYAPIVSCSRCALGIPWPMSFDVGVRFMPTGVNTLAKDRAITKGELDQYFLEDDEVDLESLINDLVQTGIPSRLLVTTDDGSSCRICKADTTTPQVYGTAADATETSPFAALKGLKLPN